MPGGSYGDFPVITQGRRSKGSSPPCLWEYMSVCTTYWKQGWTRPKIGRGVHQYLGHREQKP